MSGVMSPDQTGNVALFSHDVTLSSHAKRIADLFSQTRITRGDPVTSCWNAAPLYYVFLEPPNGHVSVYSQVSPRFSLFCFHRELLRWSEHLRPSVCLSSTDLKRLLFVHRRGASTPFQTRLSMADCWTPVKLCLSPSPLPPTKLLPPIGFYTQAHVCTAS